MMVLTSPQRQALLALAELHQGRVTPEIVVEAARDPASPLHSAFTWDDAQAAHEHRLAQARVLLRRGFGIAREIRHADQPRACFDLDPHAP